MEHGFSGRSGRKFLEATELVMHEKIVLFFLRTILGTVYST